MRSEDISKAFDERVLKRSLTMPRITGGRNNVFPEARPACWHEELIHIEGAYLARAGRSR